jgi:hypothetical protein
MKDNDELLSDVITPIEKVALIRPVAKPRAQSVRPVAPSIIPTKRKLSSAKKLEKASYPSEALVAEVDLGSSNDNSSELVKI